MKRIDHVQKPMSDKLMKIILEKNKIQCKCCKLWKYKLYDGTYRNSIDENGYKWNGLICPACHRQKMRHYRKIGY